MTTVRFGVFDHLVKAVSRWKMCIANAWSWWKPMTGRDFTRITWRNIMGCH